MINVRTMLAAIALGGLSVMALMVSPPAKADVNSYLSSLGDAGYNSYKTATWMNIGNDICQLEAAGVPKSIIASKVVVTTGSGIYTADAYEIIGIANANLCQGASQNGDGSYAA